MIFKLKTLKRRAMDIMRSSLFVSIQGRLSSQKVPQVQTLLHIKYQALPFIYLLSVNA